jgi:hypothetical protein
VKRADTCFCFGASGDEPPLFCEPVHAASDKPAITSADTAILFTWSPALAQRMDDSDDKVGGRCAADYMDEGVKGQVDESGGALTHSANCSAGSVVPAP